MRRWLIVVDDLNSELANPEEAKQLFKDLIHDSGWQLRVNTVQRGGLLAERIVGELVPVRHKQMGRPRG